MTTSNVSFAKISATPTESAWSQAHNAGSLFLVLSLTVENEETQKELPAYGKKLINGLQAEFFGLENKTLETIEQAIARAMQEVPTEVLLSLALTYIKDNILYVFVKDGGKVVLKRDSKVGTILESHESTLTSASGYLSTNDMIMLQTKQFSSAVPHETLTTALDYTLPSDIAETLTPHVHGGHEGAASAIIVSFQGSSVLEESNPDLEEEKADEEELVSQTSHPTPVMISNEKPHINSEQPHKEEQSEHSFFSNEQETEEDTSTSISFFSSMKEKGVSILSSLPLPQIHLTKRHKLILTVAILISLILLVSIYFATTSQSNKKYQALFEEAYASAQKDYDEGMSLLSLNKALAKDDFQRAKDTITEAKKELPESSEEAKKLAELEAKVDEKLQETQSAKAVTISPIEADDAPLLALQKEKKAQAVTEDEENWYYLTNNAVFSVNKETEKEEEVFENDDTWTKALSLSVFSGNLYILDPQEGIIKLVPTSKGYSATSYFTSNKPDLSNAVSMAIDASIYVLFKDGSVSKYTRGTKDSFSLSGLPTQLSSPFMITTSPDMDSLYIVDKGTASLLKFNKDGSFQQAYQAEQIKNAQAVSISQDETTATLMQNTTYSSLSL